MSSKLIAMIPARMGSQRLKNKNLAILKGEPLIAHAIRKCFQAGCFDEVWVNTESDDIAAVAISEGAKFHKRTPELANNLATSEEFVTDFFKAHACQAMFQVHSIAPLLSSNEVGGFVKFYKESNFDVLLSCIHDQIEVAFDDKPVNFTFESKTNSQDLVPVQRITWSITGWSRATFLEAVQKGKTATYFGRVGFYPVSAMSGHVIKTKQDLDIAAALMDMVSL